MAKVNPIQLQKALKGISYPADKAKLLETAKRNNADDSMQSALKKLPDQDFNRPSDVSKAVRNME
jgi:hypothetical protein